MMIGAMKGGVGKSVTAFNLAYSLQKRGKRVLAVDSDPQANPTTCFGMEDVHPMKASAPAKAVSVDMISGR